MENTTLRQYITTLREKHFEDFQQEVENKAREMAFPILDLFPGQSEEEKRVNFVEFSNYFLTAIQEMHLFQKMDGLALEGKEDDHRYFFEKDITVDALVELLNIYRHSLMKFTQRFSNDVTIVHTTLLMLDDYYLQLEDRLLENWRKLNETRIDQQSKMLQQKNRELEKINRSLDNFVYAASSDLKAPVANIEGLMNALVDTLGKEISGNEDFSMIMQMVNRSVSKFKDTIQDLAEMSRIGVNVVMDVEEVNLCELIREVQDGLSEEIRESEAVIHVDASNCPSIRFSRRNLKYILFQLLSNAIKYRSEERTPEISVSAVTAGDYKLITVTDNGVGMGYSQKRKLFSMFKQSGSQIAGTGLGLYIVKRIVDNTNGKIEVESEINTGTTFKVYLKDFN